MQSSAAIKQSCTCGKRNHFFPVNEEKEEKDKEVKEVIKDEEKEEEEVVEEEEEVEIRTTMQVSVAMQQSFTHGQGNFFFPVNKVEEKGRRRRRRRREGGVGEGGGEGEEEEEEVEIRPTMQSSVAMQQSCTCWSRQLFPVNNQKMEEEGEEEEIHNYNAVFCSNESELYLWRTQSSE